MNNQEILVDTSALISFFIKTETHHQVAKNYVFKHSYKKWIILNTIFDETVTWFRTKVSSQASVTIGEVLRLEHRYINLSNEQDEATWILFKNYSDKQWSYTDCSLLLMSQELQIPQIFAFDSHIRQMAGLGVVCVP
jgi:predicted nucleic acid-binding protein